MYDGEDSNARLVYKSLRSEGEIIGPRNVFSSGRSLTFEFDYQNEEFYDNQLIEVNYEFVKARSG